MVGTAFSLKIRKGSRLLWNLKAEMVKKSVCVAFTEKLPTIKELYQLTDVHSLKMPRISSVNVYRLHGDLGCFISIGRGAGLYLTSDRVWITTAKEDSILTEMNCILHSLHGGFSFSLQKRDIPRFKHLLKTVNPSQYPEDVYFSNVWL